MYIHAIKSDPNTNSNIAHVRLRGAQFCTAGREEQGWATAQVRSWVLNFAQQEAKRRDGHTYYGGFASPAKGSTKTWAIARRAPAVALVVAHES